MKLTSQKALELLKEIEKDLNDNYWIRHSICVGNTAGIIAAKLGFDVDKAKTMGYIHDIGKKFNDFPNHDINGYNYVRELGYDDEYASICFTHSYLNNDINCTPVGMEVPDNSIKKEYIEKHQYTVYEKLVSFCDLISKDTNMTLEKRLIDIFVRKGVNENTVYHIKESYKLKEYIDGLLGYNVYNLFPDIEI